MGRLTLLKVSFDEAQLLFVITAAIEEIYRRYMTSLNLDNSEIKRIRDELPYMELYPRRTALYGTARRKPILKN